MIMNGSKVYKVRRVTVVDHPERRNDTYPIVPAGHRIPSTRTFTSQADAVAFFRYLCSSENVFSSEYNTDLEVWAEDLYTYAQRTVRKRVVRENRGAL